MMQRKAVRLERVLIAFFVKRIQKISWEEIDHASDTKRTGEADASHGR